MNTTMTPAQAQRHTAAIAGRAASFHYSKLAGLPVDQDDAAAWDLALRPASVTGLVLDWADVLGSASECRMADLLRESPRRLAIIEAAQAAVVALWSNWRLHPPLVLLLAAGDQDAAEVAELAVRLGRRGNDWQFMARVANLLHLEADGVLRWRVGRGSARAGAVAGYIDREGYAQVKIDGKAYRAHRLVHLLVCGRWPDEIDHIDGRRDNNDPANIRDVPAVANSQNRRDDPKRGGIPRGASWHQRDKVWRALVTVNGRQHYLGSYADMDEAGRVAAAARERLHVGHVTT